MSPVWNNVNGSESNLQMHIRTIFSWIPQIYRQGFFWDTYLLVINNSIEYDFFILQIIMFLGPYYCLDNCPFVLAKIAWQWACTQKLHSSHPIQKVLSFSPTHLINIIYYNTTTIKVNIKIFWLSINEIPQFN